MIDIIATIGLTSSDYQTLKKMKLAGMTIARVNMNEGFELKNHIKEL
jgi:pyruvate kinase